MLTKARARTGSGRVMPVVLGGDKRLGTKERKVVDIASGPQDSVYVRLAAPVLKLDCALQQHSPMTACKSSLRTCDFWQQSQL